MAVQSWNTYKTGKRGGMGVPNTRKPLAPITQTNPFSDQVVKRPVQQPASTSSSNPPGVSSNTNPTRRWQSWQTTKPKPVKRPSALHGSAGWSTVGAAYNPADSDMRGFLRDPASSTGWSWIDRLGRVHEARAPMKGEQKLVLNENQILALNPDYYNPGHKAVTPTTTPFAAPWLQGFAPGSGGWLATNDGGYFNPATWQSWKPGDPIPSNTGAANPVTGSAAGGGLNSFESQLYQSLLKAFGGV